MEGFRRNESWTSSDASSSESLAHTMSLGWFAQQQLPSLDSLMSESTSTEWTDEKHNLYLKSMEASFVDQLYDSMDFLPWKSQKENFPGSKLSRQSHRTSSGQFKVLRGGSWNKINFKRAGFQSNKRDHSRCFMASPWIQHFRSGSKSRVFASGSHLQHNAPPKGKTNNSNVEESNFCI
ncbi:cold-regulated protein 27-like isoform X1 [Hibiscus syriacus]|uniref:cold-regulated protein 27-like isoform X1 n=1 Tax=Hibiscus syriacus TaxID=106335 RepID=UPI0019246D60|nr:cold-regulated protein 27-like isoform X1 [Hibiscus syriacus]